LKLVQGPIHWFADSTDAAMLIRETIPARLNGVYCLWWKDPTKLPKAPRIDLAAGSRGKQSRKLKLHLHGLGNSTAMYVGKGKVRSRLCLHIKPAVKSSRNPYWWITQIIGNMDAGESIRLHLGFSFIEESNKYEQIYIENLAIGILRPWFNLRCTA
jgi:hypothetical protein